MPQNIEDYTARFDEALFVTMQNLGPQLIKRAHLELTPGQVFMLHLIQQEGQCSQSKLAEHMEVSPSAITIMLDRLENHGYVERKRDSNDRRVVMSELTSTGTETLLRVMRVRQRLVQHCLSKLPAEELDRFINTLEQLADISAAMEIEKILEQEKGVES